LQVFLKWWLPGILLIILHLAVARLSQYFEYGGNPLERPIRLLVGAQLSAGAIYLFAVLRIRNASHGKVMLLWIILVGFALRAALLFSTPILEDDYYRYLWDGAVVAGGMNPYSHAPGRVLDADEDPGGVPADLHELAERSGPVASRINHPNLRTIYPPVAQGAFALAHWLRPWSMLAWRLVLLLFDVAALVILLFILQTLRLPLLWVAIYWWNPVLIKETFNSGHMDVVAVPFVLMAVLLAVRGNRLVGVVSLALAAGAKVWPVVLAPLFLRPLSAKPKRLVAALCLLVILSAAMFVPIYAGGLDNESGFTAYGKRWEMNDSLYMLFHWSSKFLMKAAGLHTGNAQLVARVVVLLLLALWIGWLARDKAADGVDLCEKCLYVVAAVFLLSPTQFPWYFIWILPFLAISPRPSLLLLTALLPLYYLRFYFDARDNVAVFDYGIVWLEFAPVWFLLIWEWHKGRRQRASLPSEVAA
jgi:hypothetical protein